MTRHVARDGATARRRGGAEHALLVGDMSSLESVNRQWLLAERPTGAPTLDTLRLVEAGVPTAGAGQMLLRTEFLSLDPYMRGRMSDAPSYAPPVPLGGVMVGGTVARVVTSEVAGFAPGDWVPVLGDR